MAANYKSILIVKLTFPSFIDFLANTIASLTLAAMHRYLKNRYITIT